MRNSAAPEPAAPADAPADALALKQAFLRGAGVPAEAISAELTPALMELLGKLMANSLQGTIDLLALRSLFKQEANADVTMVVVRNNNPLKFFPDSQTVLTQMLRKKMPGFLEPLDAMDDAWRDLRGHQMGVVAGTRAGMQALISELDPNRIEAELPASGLLDKLMPSRRAAARWQLYAQRHADLAGEAHERFNSRFGAAFLAAYEHEVERLNDEQGNG